MALNLPVFYQRTGSAIIFAAIMLAGMLTNTYAFFALICVINALCLRDFFRLMKQIDKYSFWPESLPVALHIIAFSAIACFFAITNKKMPMEFTSTVIAIFLLSPVVLLVLCILPRRNSFAAFLQAFGGLFYVTLPMMFLLSLANKDPLLPIALILMIWTNDTMAYLVGSFIGKTPFSPISPKKTWEGTAGGALLTIGGAVAYGYFSHLFKLTDWAALALCAGVAGTMGDLVESKLKRMADVKDSGTLLPGHGGALDRFDSLLLAAPFAGAYVYCCM